MAKAAKNGNGHNLKVDPRNARKHSDRNQKLVKQSLGEVGAFRSVGADANGIIRVGNQTYQAAQDLGYKIKVVKGKPNELIVVQRDDLKGKQAIRAAVLDNMSADSSAYDYDADILAAIAKDDDLVAALIKEDAQLAELMRGDVKPEAQDPAQARQTLAERFIVPPFSVLDARQGCPRRNHTR